MTTAARLAADMFCKLSPGAGGQKRDYDAHDCVRNALPPFARRMSASSIPATILRSRRAAPVLDRYRMLPGKYPSMLANDLFSHCPDKQRWRSAAHHNACV